MSTLSALLVLSQGAFLSGSWWVARALRSDDGRIFKWVIWGCLLASVAGSTPEVTTALAGNDALANSAHFVGLVSIGSMAVSQIGLGAVAGGRAFRSAQDRARLALQAVAQLAQADAAFAGGRYDEARATYQQEVSSAQAAGQESAIRQGLARIAWLDYVSGRFEEARASAGWAAGGGDLDDAAGSSVVLLAGCLGLAAGRLDMARPAIEDAIRMSAGLHDVSQEYLARVVLGCEHYLEGWGESGRQYIETHARENLDAFDRQVAGALLVALGFAARHRGRPDDARGLAAIATKLVGGNAVLEPLAGHLAQPEASPWLERPARAHMRLVLPVSEPPAPAGESTAPVAKTQPPVADTQPPVAETQPPVADTQPPVAETHPPVAETRAPTSAPSA